MAYTYRLTVVSAEAAANGNVHLDTWVERSNNAGANWTRDVPNGHFTVVLDGAAVTAITDGAGSAAQKRAALAALFKAEVGRRGIDRSDDALTKLEALVTWPQSVALG